MVKDALKSSLYDTLPNLTIGFHGCNKKTYEAVLHGNENLKKSENDYDWLGHGIYFWENGYERAKEWAVNKYGTDGMVIGAVISLGYCLNLTDIGSTSVIEATYSVLKAAYDAIGVPLPANRHGRSEIDYLLRNLDCMVIQATHDRNRQRGAQEYDSVRGVFTEGEPCYPGSGIPKKTHIQICVVNPNCIKGYFAPKEPLEGFNIP
ncbi:MAG: hypothetical protein K6G24_11305 [Lachnospiraceae bacterium]|nr:hypothetical protein [Lachnospiraceae bacterium]